MPVAATLKMAHGKQGPEISGWEAPAAEVDALRLAVPAWLATMGESRGAALCGRLHDPATRGVELATAIFSDSLTRRWMVESERAG